MSKHAPLSVFSLPDGPLLNISLLLEGCELCHVDVSSPRVRGKYKELFAWRNLGKRDFSGLELSEHNSAGTLQRSRYDIEIESDWKRRYYAYRRKLKHFRWPYEGPEIGHFLVTEAVTYLKAALQAEKCTFYLEFLIMKNHDNLSLAVVDFDDGGKSSATFSPDTGAVITEKKTRENPRKVEGHYTQPLSPDARRFEGLVSMHIRNSRVSFFRRYGGPDSFEEWESTGYVIDVAWACGRPLTPCLAFRDEGEYKAKVTRSDSGAPPVKPVEVVTENLKWFPLNWEQNQVAA